MRWVKFGLMLAMTVGLLVLTAHTVGVRALLAGWQVLTPWTIVMALACGLIATAAQALRWKLLLDQRGTTLGWSRALSDCYASSLLNMILPGGLGGDLARVAVYRHTGNYRWLSPLVAVGAERLSATALLFTTAAFTLMYRAPTLALGAGMIAVVAVVLCLYAMRGMALTAALTVWLTAAVSTGALLMLYVVGMLALGGPVILGLAVAGLASMSIPIGVGGWGVRELFASLIAGSVETSAHWAVATATGYGLLATISVLPGVVTLVWQMLIRHRAAAPGSGRNAVTQPD